MAEIVNTNKSTTAYNGDTTTITVPYWDNTTTGNTHYTYWSYPNYVYLYQIRCPKKSCKTYNWLQIDVITECTGCRSKLKAIRDQADYEIPING